MGQKTNPIGFRLGIVKPWASRWFATKDMPALLKEDELIRKYLLTRLGHAAIAEIHVERRPGKVTVTVHTGRPGVVIGKKGTEVDKLRDELAQLTGKEAAINVEEIKRPETSAQLVADNIAHQLQQRISFRRAMKRSIQSAMRMGAQGIKVRARSRGPRATTRAGCRCTPCGPTSTTPPAPPRRPTAPSGSRSGSSRARWSRT
jgi:small subunit ribosomal protein S3